MAAKRTLPDAEPRACVECETVFTPPRKSWEQRYCSLRCQRAMVRRAGMEAARKPESVARRADMLRDRGKGKSYRKRGGRHEHIVVMEQTIGRALLPGETVHHKDRNKRNNDPSNLVLLGSQAEHCREHQPYFGGKRYVPPKSDRRCSLDGCDRPHIAKGLCNMHYLRARGKRGAQP